MDPETVALLINAVEGSHWTVLAGIILTILVWVARRMIGSKKLPPKVIPVWNAVIAVAVAVADLLVLDRPWYEALATGFLVGASASGFWSMLGKRVLPLPDEPVEPDDSKDGD